ncbi:MAG: hypothetical protein GX443_10485 [Deltaproteobacteria bacterium]|nr:hypothetical protein [Deltaproteobacteria bacterium]
MIVYLRNVSQDENAGGGIDTFIQNVRTLDVNAVCLATSQEQILQCWWSLIREGMHRISYVSAAYDSAGNSLHSFSSPSELMGCT